jgi:hypothetical protein
MLRTSQNFTGETVTSAKPCQSGRTEIQLTTSAQGEIRQQRSQVSSESFGAKHKLGTPECETRSYRTATFSLLIDVLIGNLLRCVLFVETFLGFSHPRLQRHLATSSQLTHQHQHINTATRQLNTPSDNTSTRDSFGLVVFQHIHTSTISTHQHINTPTHRHINTSSTATFQHINKTKASTHRHINTQPSHPKLSHLSPIIGPSGNKQRFQMKFLTLVSKGCQMIGFGGVGEETD